MPENQIPAAQIPFAAIKPGFQVAYGVMVNGKEIMSRGEVFQVRRVGNNRAEITLLHAKTGALFVNVVKGSSPVIVFSSAFAVMAEENPSDQLMNTLRDQIKEILKKNTEDFYALPIAD